jgi:transposase-like protein
MPWKPSSVMEERLRFVARLLEGEEMSHLCREFGISRKTARGLGRSEAIRAGEPIRCCRTASP